MPLLHSFALSVLLALAATLLSGYFFGCENGMLACHGPDSWCREQCGTTEECQTAASQCKNAEERHKVYRLREKHRKASLHKFWRGRPVTDEKVEGHGVPVLNGKSKPKPVTQRHPLAPLTPTNAMNAGWSEAGISKGHALLGGQKSAKLLGKTLRMNVDVSKVGCGCVTGAYLVEWGDGSQCDGSGTFAARCGEIDLFEGNKFAWHTTLHNANDHPGLAGGFGGLQQPDMNYGKGPRDMTGQQYGPGASIIDTNLAFHAAISFPKKEDGSLADMVVMLYQDGKDKAIEWRVNKPRADHTRSPPLTCEDGGCKDCFSKPGCVYKKKDMSTFGYWLSHGMTPLSTYWGGPGNTWIDGVMDDEQAEGCKEGPHGQPGTQSYGDYMSGGGCYSSWFSINGFTVEDIKNPDTDWEEFFHQMDAEPVIDWSRLVTV